MNDATHWRYVRPSLLVCWLAACGGHDPGSDFTSIEIDPPYALVTVPLGGTATQDFTVYGISDSGKRDITARCTLSVDPEFASFADATATVFPHGGKTTVSALCDTLTGSALLGVNLVGSVVLPPAPADAPVTFGAATLGTDPARTPVVEYPLDRAVSPRNMPPIEIQWTAASNDLFHITLVSAFVSIDLYSATPEAELSPSDWRSVLESASGDSLMITVEGLAQASPQTKFAGTPRALEVARDTIDQTAIYYWASSRASVLQQTFGETTQSLVQDRCTACHSVSHSGTRIGYSRCVGNDCTALYTGFLKYDPSTQQWIESVSADTRMIPGTYTTFAPSGAGPFDDVHAAAIVTKGDGTLELYDPDTGQIIPSNLNAVSRTGPHAGGTAMMANWSPDGSTIVFASSPFPSQTVGINAGSIATMTYSHVSGQHVFGAPAFPFPNPITLANGNYTNFFFPNYSPDGNLLAVSASRGAWPGNPNRTAGQRMMLADAQAAWIVDLTNMNGGFVDTGTAWGHWAPTVGTDYYWIVFSSEREYGHRLTPANSDSTCLAGGVVAQCKQLWIGAVAKAKADGTQDPSAAPMWLPGQDMKADNISPYWSVPSGLQ